MANKLRIKRRAGGGAAGAPASLENAELAFNETDKTLYYGEGTGGANGTATNVIPIGGAGAFVDRTTDQQVDGIKTFGSLPVIPTAAPGTNNTQAASTAFAMAAAAAAAAAVSIPDGDKGDLTVTAGSWIIDPKVITNAKMADVATGTFKGRTTAGAGSVEDLTIAQVKNALAINNVSNTSDADKPVSTAQAAAINARIAATEKGAVNGVATLDGTGKIPSAQLPPIAISDTFVVANQAAMLALVAEVGDVAVRTDLNKSFILRVAGAGTLANWQELLNPTAAVASVFGRTGAVAAQSGDYTVAQVTGAAPLASPTFTGTPSGPTPATANNSTQLATTAHVQANMALALLKSANLSDVASVSSARTNLGLGTMATQNANAVAITGGTIDNMTIDGGTF